MLDDKTIDEAHKRAKQYLQQKIFLTKQQQNNSAFFLTQAHNSLMSAQLLFEMSTNKKLQEQTGYLSFNGLLWVINASYYSMFYTARALLDKDGIKITQEQSIHALVFDALIEFYLLTNKLDKKLASSFQQVQTQANELLANYYFEKKKRAQFTYELGILDFSNKAKTSLKRAQEFYDYLEKIIQGT